MIVKQNKDFTLLKAKSQSFKPFLKTFESVYNTHKKQHIILDLSAISDNNTTHINQLLQWAKAQKKAKLSFIVIAQNIDIDSVSNQINCTPTLTEAKDILEMEAMERDLGF